MDQEERILQLPKQPLQFQQVFQDQTKNKDLSDIQFSLNQVKSLIEGKLSSFQKFLEGGNQSQASQQQLLDNTFASNKILENYISQIQEICKVNIDDSQNKSKQFTSSQDSNKILSSDEKPMPNMFNKIPNQGFIRNQSIQGKNWQFNNQKLMNQRPVQFQQEEVNQMYDEQLDPEQEEYYDDEMDDYEEDQNDYYNVNDQNLEIQQQYEYEDPIYQNQNIDQSNIQGQIGNQYSDYLPQKQPSKYQKPFKQLKPNNYSYQKNYNHPQQQQQQYNNNYEDQYQYLPPPDQIQQPSNSNYRFNQQPQNLNYDDYQVQEQAFNNGYVNSFNYQQKRAPGQPLRNKLEQQQRLDTYRKFEMEHHVQIPKFFKSTFYLQKTPRSRFFQHLTNNEFYAVAQIYEKLGTQQQVADLLDTSVPNVKRILTTVKQQIESGAIEPTTPFTILHQQIR